MASMLPESLWTFWGLRLFPERNRLLFHLFGTRPEDKPASRGRKDQVRPAERGGERGRKKPHARRVR